MIHANFSFHTIQGDLLENELTTTKIVNMDGVGKHYMVFLQYILSRLLLTGVTKFAFISTGYKAELL